MEGGGRRTARGNRQTAASFCSRFNGMERSCLPPPARAVPHHSTYKSGPVIKLYHQAHPPTAAPPALLFPTPSVSSFSRPPRLASPAICSLPPTPAPTPPSSCQVRQHARPKRELRGTIRAETRGEEEQIKALGMRMETSGGGCCFISSSCSAFIPESGQKVSLPHQQPPPPTAARYT